MKKPKHDKTTEDHDPKTCFRCRLHHLYEEIGDKYGNEPQFMLMSLAEAAGSMLSQLDEGEALMFMLSVQKFMVDDIEKSSNETKH
jgi:hypothetical protein